MIFSATINMRLCRASETSYFVRYWISYREKKSTKTQKLQLEVQDVITLAI